MTKIESLAYVVAESTDVTNWRTFAEQILGAAAVDAPGGLDVKIDERDARIAVVKGDADRYVASGWEVASDADFAATIAALRKAGVEVRDGTAAEASARRFTKLAHFADPAGNRHELVTGYTGGRKPFVSPIGVAGFKTGKYGMGHTVLPAIPFEPTLALFKDVLGFGLSDVFKFQPGPDAPVMRIYFLHAASGRHHSIALAEMPNPAGCVHIMLEVNSMTDVGLAHDRVAAAGTKMMATLGEHENDRMTSFYIMTPSNFALEYGWGGMIVDPATFQTTETQRVSIWGHDFSVGFR